MLNVKQLLRDAVVEEIWVAGLGEWFVLIPKELFTNIVDHLVRNEEEEDG